MCAGLLETNLVGQHRELVTQLGRLMRDYIIKGRSTPGEPQQNDRVKSWQQTQWLDEFKATDPASGVPANQPQ